MICRMVSEYRVLVRAYNEQLPSVMPATPTPASQLTSAECGGDDDNDEGDDIESGFHKFIFPLGRLPE